MPTYPALVYLTAHSRPTKRCCGVGKMNGHVTHPSKLLLHKAPHDAASATALLTTVNLRTKHVNKYEFTNVHQGHTHADEKDALRRKLWCGVTMVERWTARLRTLQRCHQPLKQVVRTYTAIVHYSLHSTMYQHSPPRHHTVLLWGGDAGWNDSTLDMPPPQSLAWWGECTRCCSNTWNVHSTCLPALPYYCSC